MKWNLDKSHSEVTFKVRHMMIAHVTGSFETFTADVTSEDAAFNHPQISFQAEIASMKTGDAQRDGHLLSADFFDVENYPHLTFKSTAFGDGKLIGDLSLHGVTQSVVLDVEDGGTGVDPWGNHRRGFTITGIIRRSDFGLTWNAALETGGFLVGDDVKISCEIQLIQSA